MLLFQEVFYIQLYVLDDYQELNDIFFLLFVLGKFYWRSGNIKFKERNNYLQLFSELRKLKFQYNCWFYYPII